MQQKRGPMVICRRTLTRLNLEGQAKWWQWPVEEVTQLLDVLWCSRLTSEGSKSRTGILTQSRKPSCARLFPSMLSYDTETIHRDALGRISRKDAEQSHTVVLRWRKRQAEEETINRKLLSAKGFWNIRSFGLLVLWV